MRTKKLLFASAIAVLFASCANEVIETNNVAQGERAMVSNVTVKPVLVEEQDDTRATWSYGNASWSFNEASDAFGALLMDTWTHSGYTFTDYTHTNYKFISEDGGFHWEVNGGHAIQEGNYFFTYPFEEEFRNRGHVYYNVPDKQTVLVKNENGVYDAAAEGSDNGAENYWQNVIRNYQKYLGYSFITEDDNIDGSEVEMRFHPLFANPKFAIRNGSGGDVRMIKLIIRQKKDQMGRAKAPAQPGGKKVPSFMIDWKYKSEHALMPTVVQLDPTTRGSYGKPDFASVWEGFNGEYSSKQEREALFSHATTPVNGFFGMPDDCTEEELEKRGWSTEGTWEYVIDCGENYIVPHGEQFVLSAIMPAGEYFNFDVYAFVEGISKNGVKTLGFVRFEDLANAPEWNNFEDTQNASVQTLLVPGKTQVCRASFDDAAIANLGVKDFTVTNSADMEWIMRLKAKDGGNDMVVIKTLGEEVELTEGIYNIMKDERYENINWVIDGAIVIPAGAKDDAIDQLTTLPCERGIETTIINRSEKQVLRDLNRDGASDDDEYYMNIINEAGTIESETGKSDINGWIAVLAGGVTVDMVKNTDCDEAAGQVYVAEGAEATVDVAEDDVCNYGEFDANKVEGDIYNAGTATVGEVDGDVENDGTATITDANSDVENNNTLDINNVDGTLNNNEGGTVDANGGTIVTTTNNATINVEGATDFVALTNNGTFNVNTKDVTVEGTNNGTITVAAAAELDVREANDDELFNYGTMNINGDAMDNIKNSGLINVIGNGNLIVNGCIEDEGRGIIDVSQANGETTSQQAKDRVVGETGNYFRYTVKNEVNQGELSISLKNRISDNNWVSDATHKTNQNSIILIWDATSAAKFAGVVELRLVERVIIKRNLDIIGLTEFNNLKNGYDAYDAKDGDDKKALWITNNSTLTLTDDAEFNLKNGINVTVDKGSEIKANDHSIARSETVTVYGEGNVTVASQSDKFRWKPASATGFTGKWFN